MLLLMTGSQNTPRKMARLSNTDVQTNGAILSH
jgi:hypothetical protein